MKTNVPIKVYWVGFTTMVRREAYRFISLWAQTILPPAITMFLYCAVFGRLMGGRIGDVGGFHYSLFITPGLVMMSVITNAYTNVVSSFFLSKWQHSIQELLVSPVPNSLILIGFVSGGVLRGLVVGAIVLGIASFFTHLHVHHIGIMILVVLMSATLFSIAGLINAIYARNFDDISIVPVFVLMPLTYLGGVFYSIDMLPHFWQIVSRFNPILYIVNVFRYGMLGYTDVPIVTSLLMMLLFIAIFFAFAMRLLRKGIGIKT